MKKFLLLFAFVALCMVSKAETQTATWVPSEQGYANQEELTTVTVDAVTLTFDKGTNSNNTPKYYTTGSAARLYGGNTLTFAVPEGKVLYKIVMDYLSSNPANEASTWTPGEFSLGATQAVWEGEDEECTFTQGGTSGHVRITKLVITYGDPGETPEDPGDTPVDPELPGTGDGTLESPFDAVRALAVTDYTPEYYVKGTVSYIKEISISYGNATYSLSDDGTQTDQITVFRGKCFDGEAFTRGDEIALGDKIVVKGKLTSYNGVNQLAAGSSIITINGETSLPEIPAENVDALYTLMTMEAGFQFCFTKDLTVIYANGKNIFVTDGISNGLIYTEVFSPVAGDVIKGGWTGYISNYNGNIQLMPNEAPTVEGTATVPEPMVVEAEDVSYFVSTNNPYAYIQLLSVELGDATPASGSFTGTMGEETVAFYNQFKLASVEAGKYDIVGFVAQYNGNPQVYVSEFIPIEEMSILVDLNDIPQELNKDQTAYEVFLVGLNLTVMASYPESMFTFVTDGFEVDGPNNTLIFGLESELKPGDVLLKGWEGQFDYMSGGIAWFTEPKVETVEEEVEFTPTVIANDQLTNQKNFAYIKVNNYLIDEEILMGGSVEQENGDIILFVYDILTMDKGMGEPEEVGDYNLTGYIAPMPMLIGFSEDADDEVASPVLYAFYLTDMEYVGPAGIASVESNNAPVEFYNLQGVKIANPAAGQIVIRKQGEKVSKIIVR